MSKLSFHLDLGSTSLESLDLPVEVRKPNYVLVMRTTASQTIEVEPGTYFCSVTLPAGTELLDRVEVKQGQEATARLAVPSEYRSPHEVQAPPHFLKGLQAARRSGLGDYEALGGEQSPIVKIKGYRGNVLQGSLAPALPWQWPPSYRGDLLALAVHPADNLQWAQILQPKRPALNIALPTSSRKGCRLFVTPTDTGHDIHVQIDNLEAEALTQYLFRGRMYATSGITKKYADASVAEQLLAGKLADPIAATVGAYALLRLDEVALLHDWTENLRDWFRWLPDGVVIRAEHQARRGHHAEALAHLLTLAQRGLPLFTDGLSLAIDRLRYYMSASKHDSSLGDVHEAKRSLEQLQRIANYVDFRQPFLTYTGLDLLDPNDDLLPHDLRDFGGDEIPLLD